ncbi:MAG: PHP domain-containing protein [Chloroflexi bacterium]|nr:PHP domain-containing protein [Chloroflexota bacterium]
MSNFTYLHVHTRFSQGGGPASAEDWCLRAAALGYNALGVADRAPLAGLPDMTQAAQRAGIALIYGAELDILLPVVGPRKTTSLQQTVVLFARDLTGMQNLARIASVAFADWPDRESPAPWEKIAAHAEGLLLILLGGDEAGAFSPFISAKKSHAEWGSLIKASFEGAAFVGVPHSGLPGDSALAAEIVTIAQKMGLPPVAMPTTRYLHAADAPVYEALRVARKRAGWPREDSRSATTCTATDRPGTLYLRRVEEAAELFKAWPEAIENTAMVASLCNYLPGNLTAGAGNSAALRELAVRRLLPRLEVGELPAEVSQRLSAELRVVEKLGTAGAWSALATIADLTTVGRSGTAIPLGAPLGTADSALLAYALGLSSVNPLNYAVPSWLTAETTAGKLPPAGIEVPATQHDNLLLSLVSEYGLERVAHAASSIEITPMQALQAAGSVLGLSGEIIKPVVAEAIAKGWNALNEGDQEQTAVSPLLRIAQALRTAPLLFKRDPDTLLVAPRSIYGATTPAEWVPLLACDGSSLPTWVPWSEESLVSLAYPLLSLRPSAALSVLDGACRVAAQYPSPGFHAAEVDLGCCPETGKEVAALFKEAATEGIPYISHAALKGWKGDCTPNAVAALVARSAAAKAGHTPVAPAQPVQAWSTQTAETGGMLLYKEQFAAVAEAAAGIPPGDLTALRVALLNPTGAKETRARFVAGCVVQDLSGLEADALWDALAAAVPRLISRGTAAAWARIALWAAHFKVAHPAALLAAAMQVAWHSGERGEMASLAREAKRLGINILPPDVNHSEAGLTLERADSGWAILWGLSLLPGWSMERAARLIAARPREGFTSMRDLLLATARLGLAPRQLEMLARAGGCDKLLGKEQSRIALADALPTFTEWAQRTVETEAAVQVDLFSSNLPGDRLEEPEWKRLLAGSPLTPRGRHSLRAWEEEKLGISFTEATEIDALVRAIEKSGDLKDRLLTSDRIGAEHVGQSVYLLGILCRIELLYAPDGVGEPMAAAMIEDLNGTIELVAFPPNYKRHQGLWVENKAVIVTGRVSLHTDGELYLLCEHMAAYSGDDVEEAFTVTVTVAKPRADNSQAAPSEIAPEVAAAKAAPLAPKAVGGAKRDSLSPATMPAPTTLPTYRLIITLPGSSDDHADIDRMIDLSKALAAHPGTDAVTLRIPYSPETGSITSAQLPQGVSYNALLEGEIRDLLGPDALAIIKLIG